MAKQQRQDRTGERAGPDEQWFRSLFTRTTSAIVRLGLGAEVIECNDAFRSLTGMTQDEAKAQGIRALFAGSGWRDVRRGLEIAEAQDSFVVETAIVSADDESQGGGDGKGGAGEIAVMVGVTPAVVDGRLAGHFLIIRNMTAQKRATDALQETLSQLREARDTLELQVRARTRELEIAYADLQTQMLEREQAEAKVRWQAFHDPLTGLSNRAMFRQQLGAAIGSARLSGSRIGLLFLDLDRFKAVNDTFGHAAGDELLVLVGSRLSSGIGSGRLVSRMGGDEFTVVLDGLSEAGEAQFAAQQLLTALSPPFLLCGAEVSLACSIGISIYPDDGEDCDSLLQRSDIAMYSAKGAGGGAAERYAPPADLDGDSRLSLASNLRTQELAA